MSQMLIRDHPRLLTLTWHAGSHQPVVNGALPKVTGPIWTSQGKNSLHPTRGRIKTNTSTLLSPIKIGGLDFQCSAPFWVICLFIILSGECTLALFYISKSVSIFISVQQHSLCSAASCLFLCFNKLLLSSQICGLTCSTKQLSWQNKNHFLR
jgi:hypothetical protein